MVTPADSFLLSETLKYMHLMFDDEHWLRSGQWVLSTEAHPMFISGKPVPGVPQHQPVLKKSTSGSLVPTRKKCPRRSSMDRKSSCGIGMPGTDYPSFNVEDIRPAVIPIDVQSQVRERLLSESPPLRIGDVVFGSKVGFRVARVFNGEVLLSALNIAETAAARDAEMKADLAAVHRQMMLAAASTAPGRRWTPNFTFLRVLAASHGWGPLNMCMKAEAGE